MSANHLSNRENRRMKGGIQLGTTASSTESVLSENRHIDLVAQVIREMGSDWSIRKSMPIEEIIGYLGKYSRNANGKSQAWFSDGGFIYHKDILVGVCENKWQAARANACERVCKYLAFMQPRQLFVSCEGPGFIPLDGGGATGPLIDVLRWRGATVLENVTDPVEYKRQLYVWLNSLVEE